MLVRRMSSSDVAGAIIGVLLLVPMLGLMAFCLYDPPEGEDYEVEHWWNEGFAAPVNDRPYQWAFDESQDMQEPELPTGCEATAASTLVRMGGWVVTKQEMAEAMPKDEAGTDFVHKFWGDPESTSGWATMAPCIVDTINSLGEMRGFAAFDMTGTALADLTLPAECWVTIDMTEPVFSGYEQQGYKLAWNPHAVTVTEVTDEEVSCVDPLRGCVTYDRETFEEVFDEMGRQAVIVKEWH